MYNNQNIASDSEKEKFLDGMMTYFHLSRETDFVEHLFDVCKFQQILEIEEDFLPKEPALLGRVIGLERFIETVNERVLYCCSNSKMHELLSSAGFPCEFAEEIFKKIIFKVNDPQKVLDLLDSGSDSLKDGVLFRLNALRRSFINLLHDPAAHHIFGDYSVPDSSEFTGYILKGSKRHNLEEFIYKYKAWSITRVKFALLYHCADILDAIYSILGRKITELRSKDLTSMINSVEEILEKAPHPSHYRFTPQSKEASFTERSPLQYKACRDGVRICGGTLLGSGFIDFTSGVTLPCEIHGFPVTEFSGRYYFKDLQHIEAYCIKRVNLTIYGNHDLVCAPPLLYGGITDSIESTSLTYEAPVIHYNSFKERKDIVSIKFSGRVTGFSDWDGDYFEPDAFKDCTNLREVSGTFYGNYLADSTFENCVSLIATPFLQVRSIGRKAFYNCSSLTSVCFGDNLEIIYDYAFFNCSSLTSVELPVSIKKIGANAFRGCQALTEVTIPFGIDEIGTDAFAEIPHLTFKGYPDTAAEAYAKENGIRFVSVIPSLKPIHEEYDLSRFTDAHKCKFEIALSEIKSGQKKTHWMWYIFPQISGLGKSPDSIFYSIKDIGEARAFINDEYLGGNLRKICEALLTLPSCDAEAIFGTTDERKLKSSMTLFYEATNGNELFKAVLDKFFNGKPDYRTLNMLNK